MAVWIALLILGLSSTVRAQETFRADANLVLVRFSAMREKLFVTDLKSTDIILIEDNEPRPVALFEGPLGKWQQTVHADLRILLDVSGTMSIHGFLPAKMLRECLVDRMPGHATITIYAFARDCKKLCGPTRDSDVLERAIQQSQSVHVRQQLPNASFIYASIVQVAREAASDAANRRTSLIVISDGYDNGDHNFRDAVAAARETDIVVYPIVVGHRAFNTGHPFFDLGEHTGGRGFWPPDYRTEHLSRIFQHVATQARAEYTAGYYTQRSQGKPRRRQVQVLLKQDNGLTLFGGLRTIYR